jgi:hypothetical protein
MGAAASMGRSPEGKGRGKGTGADRKLAHAAESSAAAKEVFDAIDADKDQKLSKAELSAAIRHHQRDLSVAWHDSLVDDVVGIFDADGDGMLNLEEFTSLVSELKAAGGKANAEELRAQHAAKEAAEVVSAPQAAKKAPAGSKKKTKPKKTAKEGSGSGPSGGGGSGSGGSPFLTVESATVRDAPAMYETANDYVLVFHLAEISASGNYLTSEIMRTGTSSGPGPTWQNVCVPLANGVRGAGLRVELLQMKQTSVTDQPDGGVRTVVQGAAVIKWGQLTAGRPIEVSCRIKGYSHWDDGELPLPKVILKAKKG